MTLAPFRQPLTVQVCELTACLLTLQLTDHEDVELPKASLSTVTLTLYNEGVPGTKVNNRNAQSILDANGGTVSTDGLLTLVLGNADNALLNQANRSERRVALIRWTWASGARQGAKELTYTVANQAAMP